MMRRGPRRDSHDSTIHAARGTGVGAMRQEVADVVPRGAEAAELFLRTMPSLSGKLKRGDMT